MQSTSTPVSSTPRAQVVFKAGSILDDVLGRGAPAAIEGTMGADEDEELENEQDDEHSDPEDGENGEQGCEQTIHTLNQ